MSSQKALPESRPELLDDGPVSLKLEATSFQQVWMQQRCHNYLFDSEIFGDLQEYVLKQ